MQRTSVREVKWVKGDTGSVDNKSIQSLSNTGKQRDNNLIIRGSPCMYKRDGWQFGFKLFKVTDF